ncbi:MAG: hypothetical protein HUJ73_08585 [Eubacterium sp.]|nr:hypothetical protein [Eubacterium sp.]
MRRRRAVFLSLLLSCILVMSTAGIAFAGEFAGSAGTETAAAEAGSAETEYAGDAAGENVFTASAPGETEMFEAGTETDSPDVLTETDLSDAAGDTEVSDPVPETADSDLTAETEMPGFAADTEISDPVSENDSSDPAPESDEFDLTADASAALPESSLSDSETDTDAAAVSENDLSDTTVSTDPSGEISLNKSSGTVPENDSSDPISENNILIPGVLQGSFNYGYYYPCGSWNWVWNQNWGWNTGWNQNWNWGWNQGWNPGWNPGWNQGWNHDHCWCGNWWDCWHKGCDKDKDKPGEGGGDDPGTGNEPGEGGDVDPGQQIEDIEEIIEHFYSVQFPLTAKVVLRGDEDWNQSIDGMFSIVVQDEEGNILGEFFNDEDGYVQFNGLDLQAVFGDNDEVYYWYTLYQAADPDFEGWLSPDTQVFRVRIRLVRNADGTVSAIADPGSVIFRNRYGNVLGVDEDEEEIPKSDGAEEQIPAETGEDVRPDVSSGGLISGPAVNHGGSMLTSLPVKAEKAGNVEKNSAPSKKASQKASQKAEKVLSAPAENQVSAPAEVFFVPVDDVKAPLAGFNLGGEMEKKNVLGVVFLLAAAAVLGVYLSQSKKMGSQIKNLDQEVKDRFSGR